jgi:hypothetical protein
MAGALYIQSIYSLNKMTACMHSSAYVLNDET